MGKKEKMGHGENESVSPCFIFSIDSKRTSLAENREERGGQISHYYNNAVKTIISTF